MEEEDSKTINSLIYENVTLRKVISQFNIGGKSFDLFVKNFRKSHEKTEDRI